MDLDLDPNFYHMKKKVYFVPSFLTSFLHMILTCNITLQEVRDLGVRKIGVVGLPPMGCLPMVITLEPHKLGFEIPERGCIDSLNSLSSDYNQKLQDELMAL